ncbi:uncharacterized protein SCHCODRAFT_02634340 [Schizophyllum commune H4-8]|uniref:uncharacterized protein n=1 Tax=Schizophyllum commune (strain H4-8 / FGSC 9210) TaxID=578458 RepID=UPI00215F9D29|nr:uncharacterized protein SCHCODRAFT_02634340 [Schizophyllum commune H4-8]KAI5889379.1 hypothetical protein SCHCODRAFT_02634340 [Schizophyllum commune H4-8]
MGKHTLSPAPLPPRKRAQTVAHQTPQTSPTLTFETALYDELILLCFSFLSYRDLCLSQSTSRNWARLSADNHLWKGLYLHTFGRARLRGTRGFIGRTDGREVRPLPGRAARGGAGREKYVDYRDWKWMFRISANWKSGRCVAERLHHLSPPLAGSSGELQASTASRSKAPAHILLAGALTITASASSPTPTIRLQSPTAQHTIDCWPSQVSGPRPPDPTSVHITALAMDQSAPVAGHIRIAAFLSNGGMQVYSIDPAHLSAARRCITYTPLRRAERTQQAAYHHPLLTTLSQSFDLNVYDLSGATVRRVESLSSFTSYPPSSMVLSAVSVSANKLSSFSVEAPSSSRAGQAVSARIATLSRAVVPPARDATDPLEDSVYSSSPAAYKLVLSFAVPVFPSHWSLGSTEIILAGPTPSSPSLPSAASMLHTEPSAPPFTITSTRTARALDVPQGFVDHTKLRAMRAQWSRKVVAVADTATDGRWVVLAGGEPLPSGPSVSAAQGPPSSSSPPSSPSSCPSSPPTYVTSPPVQLYRLSLPSSPSTPAKLTFVRHLYGAEGALSALSLADGRCVALGANGRVWVWDLEGGSDGVEVGAGEVEEEDVSGLKGTVAFDERTIVTANAAGVVVRRLDV